VFADGTMAALEVALHGVSERQRVTAHNVANINTPGFQASRVEFEGALAEALDSGHGIAGDLVTTARTNDRMDVRGNNVSLEREQRELITSNLQYEALVNALNFRFSALRTAVSRS
jgi:flagellar basal-body rod protein FlgB